MLIMKHLRASLIPFQLVRCNCFLSHLCRGVQDTEKNLDPCSFPYITIIIAEMLQLRHCNPQASESQRWLGCLEI